MTDRRPIRQRLAAYLSEADLDRWIYRPHRQLGNQPPSRLVDTGHAEEVHQLIDRMASGTCIRSRQ